MQMGEGGMLSDEDYAAVAELTTIEQRAASFVCYCHIIQLTNVEFIMLVNGKQSFSTGISFPTGISFSFDRMGRHRMLARRQGVRDFGNLRRRQAT